MSKSEEKLLRDETSIISKTKPPCNLLFVAGIRVVDGVEITAPTIIIPGKHGKLVWIAVVDLITPRQLHTNTKIVRLN